MLISEQPIFHAETVGYGPCSPFLLCVSLGIHPANQGVLSFGALEQVGPADSGALLVFAASEPPAQSTLPACVFPPRLVPFPRLPCGRWGVSGQR